MCQTTIAMKALSGCTSSDTPVAEYDQEVETRNAYHNLGAESLFQEQKRGLGNSPQ
jgi:phosphosulfolactate phosphohydrolase-like enzyme